MSDMQTALSHLTPWQLVGFFAVGGLLQWFLPLRWQSNISVGLFVCLINALAATQFVVVIKAALLYGITIAACYMMAAMLVHIIRSKR